MEAADIGIFVDDDEVEQVLEVWASLQPDDARLVLPLEPAPGARLRLLFDAMARGNWSDVVSIVEQMDEAEISQFYGYSYDVFDLAASRMNTLKVLEITPVPENVTGCMCKEFFAHTDSLEWKCREHGQVFRVDYARKERSRRDETATSGGGFAV